MVVMVVLLAMGGKGSSFVGGVEPLWTHVDLSGRERGSAVYFR